MLDNINIVILKSFALESSLREELKEQKISLEFKTNFRYFKRFPKPKHLLKTKIDKMKKKIPQIAPFVLSSFKFYKNLFFFVIFKNKILLSFLFL